MIVWLSLIFCITSGAQASESRRVVVIVANYLSLEDLLHGGSNLKSLISKSSIGLVNTGLRNPSDIESRYLAIGAGDCLHGTSPSPALIEAGNGADGKSFKSKAGVDAPRGSVVCLGISLIKDANPVVSPGHSAVGLLGERFHRAGLRTAVIGNADIPGVGVRNAPLIAMDARGIVDSGTIGSEIVRRDTDPAFGMRDDVEAITSRAKGMLVDHSLVVVELGDLSRTEAMKARISAEEYRRRRGEALRELDGFVGRMFPAVADANAVLLLCSPCRAVPEPGLKSDLAPAVLYRSDWKPGLLTSGTTRIAGLIRNIDICPTILRGAGLSIPKDTLGEAAEPAAGKIDRLQRMEMVTGRNYGLQVPILVGAAIFVFLSVFSSEFFLRKKVISRPVRRTLIWVLLATASLPAAFLIVDGMGGAGAEGYVVRLIAAILVMACGSVLISKAVTRFGGRECLPLGVVFLVTAGIVSVDVATGAHLLRWSILSCDHIVGIRYYGIGNEYMGFLLGMAMIGPVLFFRSNGMKNGFEASPAIILVLLIWFGMVSFLIGCPAIGANVGGLMTAVPAFGVMLIGFRTMRVRVRDTIALSLLGLLLVAGFAAMDLLRAGGENVSHLGRAISMAQAYGPGYLWTIALRKIVMHMGIIMSPQGLLPIIGGIAVIVLHGRLMRSASGAGAFTHVLYRVGLPASIVGMVVAFLFNDSGIVPAGLIMGIFVVSSLYLALERVPA